MRNDVRLGEERLPGTFVKIVREQDWVGDIDEERDGKGWEILLILLICRFLQRDL